MGYGTDAIVFLINTIFGLYILAIMLRVLLQIVRADFYNPVSQFLVKVTNPPLIPLRRLIPGFGGIDFPAIVLMFIVQLIASLLIYLVLGASPVFIGLVVLAVAELLKLFVYVFIFSILIQVVISWINPGAYNPVVSLLYSLNEPLLSRARRIIKPISGFDLSPIVALIILQLTIFLLVNPVYKLGEAITIGRIQLW